MAAKILVPALRLAGRLPTVWRKPADPVPSIGQYRHSTWLRRHRGLCYLALTLFALLYGFAFAILGRYLLVQLTAPLVALFALMLWVLPDTERVPLKLVSFFFGAFIVALLCWPDYIALSIPFLPWLTAIRITAVPLALCVLLSLSMSKGFRKQILTIWKGEPIIAGGYFLFLAIAFFSVLVSTEPLFSFQRFAIAQLSWTMPFIAASYIFSKKGAGLRFAKTIWGITVFCCVIGLWEIKFQKLPWAGHIPSFLKIEDENIQKLLSGIVRAASGIYRVQSKFSTSIGLGEYLAMSLPFVIHFAVSSRNLITKALASATVALVFIVVLKTDSRLAFISFISASGLYAFAWSALRWYRVKDSLMAPLLVLAVPFSIIALLIGSFTWRRLDRIIWGYGASVNSTEARRTMYDMGLPKVLARPWGYGMDRSAETLGYVTFDGTITIDTYFLSVLLDFGIIGFLVYFGTFGFAAYRAGRVAIRDRDAEIALLIPTAIALFNFVLSKTVYSQQENHPLAVVLLALVIALSWRSQVQQATPTASPTR